jgi:hypothetical protein
MDGVETSLGIRGQDFRARYPPIEERKESLPSFASTLAAANLTNPPKGFNFFHIAMMWHRWKGN